LVGEAKAVYPSYFSSSFRTISITCSILFDPADPQVTGAEAFYRVTQATVPAHFHPASIPAVPYKYLVCVVKATVSIPDAGA